MIEVPVEWVMTIPMAAAFALLLAASAYYSWRTSAHRANSRRPSIYRCAACGRVYLSRRQVARDACPRCGCVNQPVRR